MAKIRSDAHLYLTQTGAAAAVTKLLTSVTKANPCVVTLAAAMAGMVDGSIIEFAGTGEALLDGKAFRLNQHGDGHDRHA